MSAAPQPTAAAQIDANCPARKRPTDREAGLAEPIAPLAEVGPFLTRSEWVMVCAITVATLGVWLAGLACVSGYVWQRWAADFVAQATGWLLS